MARTIATIYNAMITEKETFSNLSNLSPTAQANPAQSLLTDLTSTSKVAIWRLIFYVIAVAIWIHESLWDIFLANVQTIISNAIPGTLQWYVATIKAFQYGYALTWNGSTFVYSTIDSTAICVNQCAITLSEGTLNIRVATLAGGTILQPLSVAQETALIEYIQNIKIAGTQFNVINQAADLLQIAYTVYYNPLIIYYNSSNGSDPLNGSLISNPSVFPVNNAILNYIQTLDQIFFNGNFQVSDLTDAIQAAEGITNVVATTVNAKSGSGAYQNILSVTGQIYQTAAGYLAIDPAYPLSSAITYIANQ